MSLKTIDLQFALHKNDEAGFRQNQLSQKPQHDQAILQAQSAQGIEKQRQRAEQVEGAASANVNDQSQEKRSKRRPNKKSSISNDNVKSLNAAGHPYKGRHIDFSL